MITPERERQKTAMHLYSIVDLSFAIFYATFAIAAQGYKSDGFNFVLSIVVAIFCIIVFFNEYQKHKQNKKEKIHLLNGIGFLLATFGCIFLSVELFVNFFHIVGPKWIGPLPAELFIAATLLQTISAFIATKKKSRIERLKKTIPIASQLIGISFLTIGAYQMNGLSNILPQKGRSLRSLNISITFFSAIAAIASLVMIFFRYREFSKVKEVNNINESSELIPIRQY